MLLWVRGFCRLWFIVGNISIHFVSDQNDSIKSTSTSNPTFNLESITKFAIRLSVCVLCSHHKYEINIL